MQLVGHPRLYQKFVGHPRFVLGIYVTNILMSCGQCIAVKFGQMPIHSVLVPIHAIGRTSMLVSEICWTSTLCIGNLCYQYINELWPMYSCESGADADPFCAGADPKRLRARGSGRGWFCHRNPKAEKGADQSSNSVDS